MNAAKTVARRGEAAGRGVCATTRRAVGAPAVASCVVAFWAIGVLAFASVAAASDGPAGVPDGVDYGAGLSLASVTQLATLLESPERFEGKPVLVRGRVSDVCQKKGCWTVLSEGDRTIRVRFKDYGFFLPVECSGKQAYAEGLVVVETLSERQARHYAAESKHEDPSAIHGPQRRVGFVASGVRLVDAD